MKRKNIPYVWIESDEFDLDHLRVLHSSSKILYLTSPQRQCAQFTCVHISRIANAVIQRKFQAPLARADLLNSLFHRERKRNWVQKMYMWDTFITNLFEWSVSLFSFLVLLRYLRNRTENSRDRSIRRAASCRIGTKNMETWSYKSPLNFPKSQDKTQFTKLGMISEFRVSSSMFTRILLFRWNGLMGSAVAGKRISSIVAVAR